MCCQNRQIYFKSTIFYIKKEIIGEPKRHEYSTRFFEDLHKKTLKEYISEIL